MEHKSILLLIVGCSLMLAAILAIIYRVVERRHRRMHPGQVRSRQVWDRLHSKRWHEQLSRIYQQCYFTFGRIPLLRRYVSKIRRRIASIHAYDEWTMRRETIHIVLTTLLLMILTLGLLLLLHQSLTSLVMMCLTFLILNNMIIDMFVHRVENRLLKQFVHFLGDVRHYYHAHGMIEEAIWDASEQATHETEQHGKKIYDILTSAEADVRLEQYYEVAPNRFLKGFAGISHLISEYGDKVLTSGSLYLNALSKLTQEVQLELLRREKLSYLLRSLTIIAVAPVLFTDPIERWAKDHFAVMAQFYDSKFGMIMKAIVYLAIIIAYVLLRKIQENDEGRFARSKRKKKWEKAFYSIPWIRFIVDRLVPPIFSKPYEHIKNLLKDGNAPIPMEWLYLHRLIYAVGTGVSVLMLCCYLHIVGSDQILNGMDNPGMMLGQVDAQSQEKANERLELERKITLTMKDEHEFVYEKVAGAVEQSEVAFKNEIEKKSVVQRIVTKIEHLSDEYVKWWEVLISFFIGWLAYYIPIALLYFQRRMRQMDLKNEVDQFHTLIGILCELDRISVENILEWLERFSELFKEPLQRCLLHYEAGAELALEELKEEVSYIPFIRTIEKFMLAVDKIPIREAFDDLESEQSYYRELRKQEMERVLDAKANWGQMIGFTPLYALIFLYLVIPLVYTSMNQMQNYYDQIQKLN
ncbi:hypothetical protein [Paenibacillus guangzhouensis]|uniref:hypothetical protein n=1 Tax=Paenibacillus guangzhouensis TaxID=1473112 RepID=UPI0012669E59|nr:hypothetical protein [Paenibacillus guangzhouensis]